MKLPDKFQQNLTLLLLAILAAFVLQPRAATKVSLSDILIKGPSINSHTKIFGVGINKETKFAQTVIKWFLALLAGLVTVKGYEYWRGINHNSISGINPRTISPRGVLFGAGINKTPKDVSPGVTQYKETLNTISSLEVKSDPPKFVKRKKRTLKNRKKSARFSSKQAKKIIASSRSLSEFMVAE